LKIMISQEIVLRKRPVGIPQESDFELVEASLRELREGEILIRNIYLSVDPYMRGRMRDRKSYTPPFQLGKIVPGGCVGKIIRSNSDKFPVGGYVLSYAGWREYYLSDGSDLTRIDAAALPIQAYLGVAGMPGMTAYVGLLDIGQPQENETVFVSAASGAVGSIVCQIARIKGCRVVGSAGSDQKVDWLVHELGVDSAFNYKKVTDLSAELHDRCPNGIDIYFENVGGAHLQAAIANMNNFGRIPVCGMISQYNLDESQPGPSNITSIVGKRLLLKGFIVSDHTDRLPQFMKDMTGWIQSGEIKWKETIMEGIENTPKAFIGLFKGDNLGKMLVRVGPDPED